MQALLDVILPVFLVIGAGYLAVWKGYFSDGGVDALMKFAQNFAIPCLLYKAMATIDLDAGFNLPLLFSYFSGSTAGFFLGLVGARLLFGRPWPDAVAIGFCCLYSNTLLTGLPITERAYGPEALAGNFAIIAVHAPYCYVLSIIAMEFARSGGQGLAATTGQITKSILQNALILGVLLGLLVNVTGFNVPSAVNDAVDLLSTAALPAALFGLGGVLSRYKPEGDLKVSLMVCGISLAIHPLISWTAATSFELDRDAFRSVVLTATMAPGANAFLFANMYGVAKRVAATSVLISTVISILTVWLWLLVIP